MQTREQPWHLRRATAKDEIRFRRLEELHQLTLAWAAEFAFEVDPVLKSWDLRAILDDTLPSESLARLEAAVWNHQAAVLSSLLGRRHTFDMSRRLTSDIKSSMPPELEATRARLDQISWKDGKRCAESRLSQGLRIENRGDLRPVFLALGDTPMAGNHFWDAFLVVRSIQSRMDVELRDCPHQSAFKDVRDIADELCRIHGCWVRGFAYGINNSVVVETSPGEPRCKQIWSWLRLAAESGS